MTELAVVIPVLNERANIVPVVEAVTRTLAGIDWEIVFVDDDSTDGTTETISGIARSNVRIRLIHRVGRIGLASACVEGMLATTTQAIAVMDGDLQHDESLLPLMWKKLQDDRLDLVVASRNIAGGSMGEFKASRVRLSQTGRLLASLVVPRDMSDPMSGFFMVSRDYFLEVVRDLSQMGFKILLDLAASSSRPVRFAEIPYKFRTRRHGESKLSVAVETDFILLVADKLIGRWIPVRYGLYGLVGLCGVAVHLSILAVLYRVEGLSLIRAQIAATVFAIFCNFFLNNAITYSDRKLRGMRKLFLGLLIYGTGCSIGAIANVGLTSLLARSNVPGLLAGSVGMLVSSVWNYAIASVFTWGVRRKRAKHRKAPPV